MVTTARMVRLCEAIRNPFRTVAARASSMLTVMKRRAIAGTEPVEHTMSHIPSDLVVDHWTSAVDSSSRLDFLSLHALWTPCGRLRSYKIMSIISVGCDFATKSGGIWAFLHPCATPGLSLMAGRCSIEEIHRGQQGTPAVTLPHRRDGLHVLWMAV